MRKVRDNGALSDMPCVRAAGVFLQAPCSEVPALRSGRCPRCKGLGAVSEDVPYVQSEHADPISLAEAGLHVPERVLAYDCEQFHGVFRTFSRVQGGVLSVRQGYAYRRLLQFDVEGNLVREGIR